MPDLDDAKKFAQDHDDQVDQGMEKAGDAAGEKLGHEDQIDKAVDKGQDATGGRRRRPVDQALRTSGSTAAAVTHRCVGGVRR